MKHQRLFYNTFFSFINQLIVLICTFILPRQILLYYGSDVNGLVSSISQFLGFIALMDMGVGAVVQSSLYKPLVENDSEQISKIIKSAQRFFNKLGTLLAIYIVLLCYCYPYFSHSTFSFSFIAPLIIAISISFFAQYFFGIARQLLLSADQRAYIHLILSSIVLVLNTAIGVLLIHQHCSIQTVKFAMAFVLLIRPLGMWLFVRKHYKIDTHIELTEEPIKQKWNGLAQHVSAFFLGHTDVVVLTLFSTLSNVSVYSVYYMVVAGIRRFVTTLMTGVYSWFGQMYAAKDPSLEHKFAFYEWLLHTLGTSLFTTAGMLIVPFVMLYTRGVHDANYVQPAFGAILLAAYAMFTVRSPYLMMILATGHYKQTQHISFMEAGLNVLISVVGVKLWGLCGVAIGTLVSMTFCTCYFAYYLQGTILCRPMKHFIKHLAVDILTVVCIVFTTQGLAHGASSYIDWIYMACKISTIALIEVLVLNMLFYKKHVMWIGKKMLSLRSK